MRIDPLWSPCGEAPAARRPAHAPLVIALHASGSSARQWRTLAARLESGVGPDGLDGPVGLDVLHGARDAEGAKRVERVDRRHPPPGPAVARATAAAAAAGRFGPRAGPGFRVLAVDLHDHGVGPAWTSDGRHRPPLTLEDEAALVAPLLAEAGRVGDGGGVHLVGHSYGGAVALKVASQHPQRVRSLVLYEPVAFRLLLDDPASHAETAEALAVTATMQTRMERGDHEGAARHFVDYWSGSGTWQAMPEPARDSIAERLPALLQHFGALYNERQQVAAVSRLVVPTLVLSGERTVATARRIAQRLCALHPAATHETLPGLGHMGPVTHAERVAERIAQHLQAMAPDVPVPAAWPPRPPFPAPAREPRDLSTVA